MQQASQTRAPSSEGTHIEQSRAIAQVQGALIVAQQRPRDEMMAMQRIRESCQFQSLAERAFFRFPRGGETVSGPSIHLATEVARCWGNVDYGITELRRDDANGESEMLSYAWDLETNNRVTNTFIVPHKRDKKGGPQALTDMRDIYENNANNAARRLRECIFRVLPIYITEEAKSLCHATLENGGGEPLADRRTKVLEAFHSIGVTRRQIERKVGIQADRMTAVDIANLRIVFKSIKQGEVRKEDEFPDDQGQAIADDVKGRKGEEPKAPPAADPALPKPCAPASAAQPSLPPLPDLPKSMPKGVIPKVVDENGAARGYAFQEPADYAAALCKAVFESPQPAMMVATNSETAQAVGGDALVKALGEWAYKAGESL